MYTFLRNSGFGIHSKSNTFEFLKKR
jgi:hypothetical protein